VKKKNGVQFFLKKKDSLALMMVWNLFYAAAPQRGR
jgi:hypothetical protein